MGCQYCGKEIGPLRLLRDDEFCSSAHRKKYRERLSKALGQAEVSEFRAKGIAGSLPLLHPFPGSEKHVGAFVRHAAPVDLEPKPPRLTVSIPPVRTALPKTLEPREPGPPQRAGNAAVSLCWLPGRLRASFPEITGAAPSAAGCLYPAPVDGVCRIAEPSGPAALGKHQQPAGRRPTAFSALHALPAIAAGSAALVSDRWMAPRLLEAPTSGTERKATLSAGGLLPRTSVLSWDSLAGSRGLSLAAEAPAPSMAPVRAGFAPGAPSVPMASPSWLRQAQQKWENQVRARWLTESGLAAATLNRAAGLTPSSPYLMRNRWMALAPAQTAMTTVTVRADLTARAPRVNTPAPSWLPAIRRAWEAQVCERWLDLDAAAAAAPEPATTSDAIPVAPDRGTAVPAWQPKPVRPQEFGISAKWLDLGTAPAAAPRLSASADLVAHPGVLSAPRLSAAWLPATPAASTADPPEAEECAPIGRWLELPAAPAAPELMSASADLAARASSLTAPRLPAAWLEVRPPSVADPQQADQAAPSRQWFDLAASPGSPEQMGAIADFAAHPSVLGAPRLPAAWPDLAPAASPAHPDDTNKVAPNGQWLPLTAAAAVAAPMRAIADFAAHAAMLRAPRLPETGEAWNVRPQGPAWGRWLEFAPSPALPATFAARMDLSPEAPRRKMPEFSWLPEAGKPREAAAREAWQALTAHEAAPAAQGAVADFAPGLSNVLVLPVPVQAGETSLRLVPAPSLAIPEPTVRTTAGWRRPPGAEIALVNVFASAQTVPAAWPSALEFPKDLEIPIAQSAGEEPPAEAGHVPLEYHCQRIVSGPVRAAEWSVREHAPAGPAFTIDAALGNLEDLKRRKGAAPIYFFPTPSAERKLKSHIIELIAAGFLLAGIVWMGGRTAARFSRTPDVKTETAAVPQAQSEPGAAPAAGRPGPIARLRRAIADRAVVEVSDSFQSDMSAWGHAKSLAPGWSRNPDGYVRTGQLALFQPTEKFADYRMEFFGQIESKSIGWVVRARDKKNYYAMKFTVIAPGLRPVIAMVHYPVIGGKPGHRIETPLNVMVHNNTPYHIGVSVQGRHIITSIEGQEVDRWADDALASGGVGFFSDPGERARLYWMKVAKNADFLGRICAYISGSPAPGAAPVAEILPIGWNYGTRYFPATRYGN